MKLLGIDYGAKHVGTALSDEEGNFAFPHMVIRNDKDLLSSIEKVIQEKHVAMIIVGSSLNYSGEKNPIMEQIEAFTKTLEKRIHAPVVFEPEVLTTQHARRIQTEVSPKAQPYRKRLDASAAALILNSYIERRK